MNKLHTLIALVGIALVGCGAGNRVDVSIFVTEPESKVSYETTIQVEKGKRIFFPSTYQLLGEVGVKFDVHHNQDGTITVGVESKKEDVIESKELDLQLNATASYTFGSGTKVTVETRKPNQS